MQNKLRTQSLVEFCLDSARECGIEPVAEAIKPIIGKPFRTMGCGDVIHPFSGERADIGRSITKEDLDEFVRVFASQKDITPVIIDWNHNSAYGGSPENSGSLGKVIDMWVEDKADGRGPGLYVLPSYNPRGAAVVEANKDALWSSPEFLIGKIYDRKKEKTVIGTGQIFAIALTGRPMQSADTIDPVRLSLITKEENMPKPDNQQEKPAEAPAEAVLSPIAPDQAEEASSAAPDAVLPKEENPEADPILALQDENKQLKAEVKALEAEVKAAREQGASFRSLTSEATSLRSLVQNLTVRAEKAEKEAEEAQVGQEINVRVARGLILPSEVEEATEAYRLRNDKPVFWSRFKNRQNPVIILNELGHSADVAAPVEPKSDLSAMAIKYCLDNGLNPRADFNTAMAAVSRQLNSKEEKK